MSTYLYSAEGGLVYKQLNKRLSENRLVLFAGAGLSCQAATATGDRPPVWSQLLVSMVEWCLGHDLIEPEEAEDIRHLIRDGFLEDAGQELKEALRALHLQDCLRDTTLCNQAMRAEAHRLVVQIKFRAYLTTNYDSFIEDEYRDQNGQELRRFCNPFPGTMIDMYNSLEPFIAKMHGDIAHPRSIVLGSRAYDKVLDVDARYREHFRTIFATSSVLFLGFGGTDPNIEALIRHVAVVTGPHHHHWILFPRGHVPALRAKRLSKDRRLYVIEYEHDDDHTGLVRFLRKLVGRSAPGDSVAGDAVATRGVQVRARSEILT